MSIPDSPAGSEHWLEVDDTQRDSLGRTYPIRGRVERRFAPVLGAFKAHFAQGLETGASVAVMWRGRPVVDLWGGYADAACTRAWMADTLCNAMSVTKAMTATCVHVLVDRGELDLDAPVSRYWPEFAANGKQSILLRWCLDNRAGLPVLTEELWPGAILDWQAMTTALAAQAPLLKPGGAPAYHIRTAGFLVGEVVRRVSGLSLGAFFRQAIAQPFDIDFHIGLGDAELARCAEFIPQASGTLLDARLHNPDSWVARAGRQLPQPLDYNAEAYRRAEVPSTNGHGNARALARFYAVLAAGGVLQGRRLMRTETLEAARVIQHQETECVMGRRYRQALGYLLNTPGDFEIGPNPQAFGLLGAGGALGFADPDAEMGFGYLQNRMHAAMGLGVRAPALLQAAYNCLT